MQQADRARALGGTERKRVEAVVETLATLRSEGESLAELAHDARNMVTALGLYCDLLEEPGVLATPFLHYGNELRLVAAASHRLVEKLVALDTRAIPGGGFSQAGLRIAGRPPAGTSMETSTNNHCLEEDRLGQGALELGRLQFGMLGKGEQAAGGLESMRPDRTRRWDPMPAEPIEDLARELEATRSLLAALAGPSISLTVDAEGCAKAVWLTGEDLTRVLVNLVKNAAEAMPAGGRIHLALREAAAQAGDASRLTLTIEDNGPGIPPMALQKVFESGYTTHARGSSERGGWPAAHRGLGLSITRSVIEGAGGQIRAVDRPQTGACFEIGLPVRTR
jgi:signal transduction histidine kinase